MKRAHGWSRPWLVIAMLLTPAVAEARPTASAPAKIEAWYDFLFHAKKVGFLQALDEPSSYEGRPAVHSLRRSVLTVRRQDSVIRMEAVTDAWCELDGRPIRFTHTRNEGGSLRKVEGSRQGDVLLVRLDVGGTLEERKIPLTGEVFLSANLDYIFKRKLQAGKRLVAKAVIEEEGDARPLSIAVVGTAKVEEGDAFVLESDLAGVKSTEHVLADGRTVRTVVERLGAEFRISTRERAIALVDPTDIFSAARILTKTVLPPTDTVDALVVRLSGRSGRAPKPILDGRQRVVKRAGGTVSRPLEASVVLQIAAVPPPQKSSRRPIRDRSLQRYLAATPYEALDDERLVTASKEAVGDASDAWDAARGINAFVHRRIKNKSLAQAFSTAVEALSSGEGDCTEHSVLFSALAKIAGIPTRLVTGLVYVGTADGIFGYHEWVEVWIGDRWVPMDPTFGQDLADPTHIKFSEGLSDGDGLREAGVVAAELFGDLDLEVIEWAVDGNLYRR